MTLNVIDMTDGWLTDWGKESGRFKEWVRELHLDAVNHGWARSIAKQPGRWLRRVGHVMSWLPFLWDDYDFDQSYLWMMVREKLKRMRGHQEDERLISDWKRVAGEIHVAEMVLTRLIEDKYVDEDWEKHYKEFGEAFPHHLRYEKPDGSVVHRPRPDPDGRRGKDIKRIADREWQCKREDARFMGDYMAKHWWGWWS